MEGESGPLAPLLSYRAITKLQHSIAITEYFLHSFDAHPEFVLGQILRLTPVHTHLDMIATHADGRNYTTFSHFHFEKRHFCFGISGTSLSFDPRQ